MRPLGTPHVVDGTNLHGKEEEKEKEKEKKKREEEKRKKSVPRSAHHGTHHTTTPPQHHHNTTTTLPSINLQHIHNPIQVPTSNPQLGTVAIE